MALYIRDSAVNDLAEQVRAKLGAKTKTDAVRLALLGELERREKTVSVRDTFADLRRQADARLGPVSPDVDLKKFMDDMWGDGDDVR